MTYSKSDTREQRLAKNRKQECERKRKYRKRQKLLKLSAELLSKPWVKTPVTYDPYLWR
jgi:hypothetical protein